MRIKKLRKLAKMSWWGTRRAKKHRQLGRSLYVGG